jgi:ribose transport system substrate-binding protein
MQSAYSIHWTGPTSLNDIQAQINLLDRAIDRRSAGIILAPNNPLALMMPVRRAVLLGIPTVVIASPLPLAASNKLFYVLNDEEEEGKIAARRIGVRLNGRGSVAILGLNPDDGGLLPRMRSFEGTLRREFPGIAILSRHLESNSEAQAEQTAHALLTGSRSPDAILALTDTATRGVVQAIGDNNRDKRIVLVSCDQGSETLYSLSLGKVDSIVAENTFEMGKQAAELILSARSGNTAGGTMSIKPLLITRENMYSPELLHILTQDVRTRY